MQVCNDSNASSIGDGGAHEQPTRKDDRAIENYSHESLLSVLVDGLSTDTPCKLHLGCGPNVLEGWINTDVTPTTENTYYLDVRSPFPIGDNQVDYIFSEHMIEHLTVLEGMRFIEECYRVLRPGGKVRISTPDLAQILSIYFLHTTSVSRYKSWAIEFNNFPTVEGVECLLINNFMHAWGHRFIYDESALRYLFATAGFVEVRRCSIGTSGDRNLSGLERHHTHIGSEANEFETMVFEAGRPEAG
jgi:predicted SAM-dependent methyltransferase